MAIVDWFSLWYNIPLYKYSIVWVFVLLLMDFSSVSGLESPWIMLLWRSWSGRNLHVSLSIYAWGGGANLLDIFHQFWKKSQSLSYFILPLFSFSFSLTPSRTLTKHMLNFPILLFAVFLSLCSSVLHSWHFFLSYFRLVILFLSTATVILVLYFSLLEVKILALFSNIVSLCYGSYSLQLF